VTTIHRTPARAALMLAILPAALAAQEPRPIPLDEAVQLARRNAPAAIQARNTIRQNAASVRTNYASFLPTLSASSGASRSEGQNVGPSGNLVPIVRPWSGSHGINTSLELFDAGRRYFNLRAAQANVDAAEASEVAQSFTVALQVKQQYFAVLAARESESAARKQLEQAEQQLRAASTRVAAGAATSSDSLRSVIQVGNARLAILTATNNLAAANAALSRLVGSTALVTAVAADTATTGGITLGDEELLRLAEEGPAVRQARASVSAAQQSARASKTSYFPTVSMRFGANYNAAADNFQLWGDSRNYQYSTSFSVNIPIFNGLGREENVVRTRVAEDNAQANLRDARLNARQQLIQQLGAFRLAESRVQIQLASVAAAEEDLRVQQQRYNLGASTLLDLLTSQTTLDQARQALIQARLDARTAKAQVEALIGRDL
jgi:outer membrane protein